jgi:hypothetical protein
MADYLSSLIAKNQTSDDSIQPRPLFRFEPTPEMAGTPGVHKLEQVEEQPRIPPPVVQRETLASPSLPPERETAPPQTTIPAIPAPAQMLAPSEQRIPMPSRPTPVAESPPIQPYRGRLDSPSNISISDQTPSAEIKEKIPPTSDEAPVPPTQRVTPETPPARQETSRKTSLPPHQEHVKPSLLARRQPPASEPHRDREIIVEKTLVPAPHSKVEHPKIVSSPIIVEDSQPQTMVPSPTILPPAQSDPEAVSKPPPKSNLPPDLTPFIPPLPDLNYQYQLSEPTPIVNVTIGRIEVRAASAPRAPVRKTSPAAAVMSLDEYLRSRTNGDGR